MDIIYDENKNLNKLIIRQGIKALTATWYRNGQQKSVVQWKNGFVNNNYKQWDLNGNLKYRAKL
jgi:antitoxin component YwqK of YwqJK toxin-antitoxin module